MSLSLIGALMLRLQKFGELRNTALNLLETFQYFVNNFFMLSIIILCFELKILRGEFNNVKHEKIKMRPYNVKKLNRCFEFKILLIRF